MLSSHRSLLLLQANQLTSLRRRALRSLSLLDPKAAIPHATKALHHKDFTIRTVAIKALVRQPSTSSLWLLKQRTKIEPNAYIKKVLTTQIQALQKKLQLKSAPVPTQPRSIK